MNVVLPKKERINTKAVVLYVVSIIICIVAAIVVACSQYFGAEELDKMIATSSTEKNTQEGIDEETLEAEFDEVFTNQIENYQTNAIINKIEESKDIVYSYYQKNEKQENYYDLDIDIPFINIDNEIIQKYNEEIKKDFIEKAENVLSTKNKSTIYTVQYAATLENDILSLMIRSNLKEGSSAQRVIIQTYHYDLKNNKEITLEEILNKKKIEIETVENKVKTHIEDEQKRVEDLKALGYNIFAREINNEMYLVKNTKQFFIKDGVIYLLYAYGNNALTSEMDVVIIF